MTPNRLVLTLAAASIAAVVTGCANTSRSRDVANPTITGAVLAQQVCSMCHGLNGVAGSPNFPNLAGQSKDYLVAQLKAFRGRQRSDPPGYEYMWGLSRSLTDAQIDGLAAYFSGQELARQPVEGEAARISAGEAIFHKGVPARSIPACAGCHGDKGQGNGMFPRLAGQHRDYLIKQLMVFQRTEQRSQELPAGAIMKSVAHELAPEDILNVTTYAQALPRQ